MAIILPFADGTEATGANSFLSIDNADTFHDNRGREDWIGDNDAKTAALIRATDHMERRFSHRWKGMRVTATQALSWPRTGVVLADGTEIPKDMVPARVAAACAEYARIALVRTELDPIPAEHGAESTGKVQRRRTSQSVGSLSTETEEDYENLADRVNSAQAYGDRRPTSLTVAESSLMEYPAADLWLDGLLKAIDIRDSGNFAPPLSTSGNDAQSQFGEEWQEMFENNDQTYGGYPTTRW